MGSTVLLIPVLSPDAYLSGTVVIAVIVTATGVIIAVVHPSVKVAVISAVRIRQVEKKIKRNDGKR